MIKLDSKLEGAALDALAAEVDFALGVSILSGQTAVTLTRQAKGESGIAELPAVVVQLGSLPAIVPRELLSVYMARLAAEERKKVDAALAEMLTKWPGEGDDQLINAKLASSAFCDIALVTAARSYALLQQMAELGWQ
jgi:hypothetical protein